MFGPACGPSSGCNITFGVAIQCAGLFYVCKGWAGERDLVTILVSIISFPMYISVVMEYVKICVLNLSSILSSNAPQNFIVRFSKNILKS